MSSAWRASISPSSVSWSIPVRCSAAWMTASPDVEGLLGAYDDVAQLARLGRRTILVHAEGQHVGRLVQPPVLAVEFLDALLRDELHGSVPIGDAG